MARDVPGTRVLVVCWWEVVLLVISAFAGETRIACQTQIAGPNASFGTKNQVTESFSLVFLLRALSTWARWCFVAPRTPGGAEVHFVGWPQDFGISDFGYGRTVPIRRELGLVIALCR